MTHRNKVVPNNPNLKPGSEEIRFPIPDCNILVVKIVLFNNGLKWND